MLVIHSEPSYDNIIIIPLFTFLPHRCPHSFLYHYESFPNCIYSGNSPRVLHPFPLHQYFSNYNLFCFSPHISLHVISTQNRNSENIRIYSIYIESFSVLLQYDVVVRLCIHFEANVFAFSESSISVFEHTACTLSHAPVYPLDPTAYSSIEYITLKQHRTAKSSWQSLDKFALLIATTAII